MSEFTPARLGLRIASLVQDHGKTLVRFFDRHASNKSDVPDLVQDVYLKLTKADVPKNFDHPGSYVLSVARSVLIDHHRRHKARYTHSHGELTEDVPDTGLSIERVLDSKAMAERMQAALLDLPERTRDVFALRTLRGLKMADVATAMQISLSTAEKHHARALAYLAEQLVDFR